MLPYPTFLNLKPLAATLLGCLLVSAAAAGEVRPRFELVGGGAESAVTDAGESGELVKTSQPAYIVVAATEHPGVLAAAKDLQRDITKIAGVTPNIVSSLQGASDKCVVIGSADCPESRALLASVGMDVAEIAGKWEEFKYRVLNGVGGKRQVLAIAGSDPRGAIYGVYDFEEKNLGVDPLWFWSDHEPPTRGELVFDSRIDFASTREPTWKYRGWTLNDHPQILEWVESGLIQRTRYGRYMFPMNPEVIQRFCEAALRLRMNMFTWYFIDIDWQPDHDALRAVVDRGLFVTQQQMEGVGADVGFWDDHWKLYDPAGKPPQLSYKKYPDAFRKYWSFYIKRWAEFSPQVVWEINQRGWADGPYVEPTLPEGGSLQERSAVIGDALADQARLVRQIDPNPRLEMMTTLYAELGEAYDRGWLKVPPGVTTGFSDHGLAGMSYSRNFWTEPRDPARKYGQYFHTQYFGGGPQIAKCTPIETYLKVNVDAMYRRGDTQHMLLAINELRLQQLEIRGMAEMLWDYPAFQAREYLQRYSREEFGAAAGPRVATLYDLYYRNFPHRTVTDEFKSYPDYYKVMEPMFTVIGNLLSIANGARDGTALRFAYNRAVYEKGIVDLEAVLDAARALRPSIPKDRLSFFDYEFIAPSQIVRGIYRLSIATQDAIGQLRQNDRGGALASLLAARPFAEALNAAFQSEAAGDRWRYWFRGSTNKDFYQLYNLFQKARLRLEVDPMNGVTVLQPQNRPYFGNVVMDDPAKAGDAIYDSQPERISASMFDGARWSLIRLPLANVFQIGGVDSASGKGDWRKVSRDDHGLAYRFELKGESTVYVAKERSESLPWLAEQGFAATGQTLDAGFWGWPYRYQNRPPNLVKTFEIFARKFPRGAVALGANPRSSKQLPYLVFVQPELLLRENFRPDPVGVPPARWRCLENGGRIAVAAIPDYAAEMRPTIFDLTTVPRYVPVTLRGLKLETAAGSTGPATAEISFAAAAAAEVVVDVRLKAGPEIVRSGFTLLSSGGVKALEVALTSDGRVVARAGAKPDVPIAPFGSGRWYNVKVAISPAKGTASVEVQDDRLKTDRVDRIEWPAGAAAEGIVLAHSGRSPASWVLYNAVSAYQQ